MTAFRLDANEVTLASGDVVGYAQLVVCPGLILDWEKVEGLPEALGRDGSAATILRTTPNITGPVSRR